MRFSAEMLVELSIRDLALIEQLSLVFGRGLNAITGETGAGKSLLVGALSALLGDRPRGGPAEWVRSGAPRARVEGRFHLEGEGARVAERWLEEHMPEVLADWEEEESQGEARELVLGRSLGADGRTRAHVNHRPVTLRALRELAPLLLELHGQHENQRLFLASEQLRLLDACGLPEGALDNYRRARSKARRLAEQRAELMAGRRDRKRRLSDRRFQLAELQGAELELGEREQMLEERILLRNAGELTRDLSKMVASLGDDDNAALERLQMAERVLDRWREEIPALEASLCALRNASAHVEDACSRMTSFAQEVELNPNRLEEIEERLVELDRLERKYGMELPALIEHHAELEEEIEELEKREESVSGLDGKLKSARKAMAEAAGKLSRARRKIAPELVRRVNRALGDLGLGRAEFEVQVLPRVEPTSPNAAEDPAQDPEEFERFGPNGCERVVFQLAANPGEPSKPLSHVASGGEAARVLLALRRALGGEGGRTLVFDEIDSGVGGHLAPAVSKHLKGLAAKDQVICVSHLAPIAAGADHHLKVSKEVVKGRSTTQVTELTGDQRVAEVADMIGGGSSHATARAEARRLIGETG